MKNDKPAPVHSAAELGAQLFESSPDCVKLLDEQGHIVSMNENGRCVMEIDNFAVVCGKPWKTLWPIESHPDIELAVASARRGEVGHFNAFCPTGKGTPRWWDVVVTPVRGDNGEVESFLSVSRDVTATHQANLERERLDERFQKIVNQAGAGVVEVDAAGRITLVNQKYCDMLGFTKAELTGMWLLDVTAPPSVNATQDALHKLQTTDISVVFDKQYLRKDGSFMWASSSVSALRSTAGAFQGIVAIVVDISERKKASEALQNSEERYRILFDSMDQGFCIIEMIYDAAGKPVDYLHIETNKMYVEHSGLVDVVGRTIKELAPGIDDFWFDTFEKVVQTGQPTRVENELPQIGRWFDVYATRLGDAGSKQVALFFRDITQRKHAAARQSFQLALADRLRPLSDPDDVTAAASELLGKHLKASRVYFVEVNDMHGTFIIRQDWTANGVPSITGEVRRLDDFGPEMIAQLRAGNAVLVEDVVKDNRTAAHADSYAKINTAAHATLPLLIAGKFSAALSVSSIDPRPWTGEQVALVQDTLERTWAAVENAKAQNELRVERDRSQAVFDTMTEGFTMIDRDWTVWYVNAVGLHYSNRTQQQVIGRNHWEIWPELVGTDVERTVRRVMETRQRDTHEFPFTSSDGSTAWIEASVYPSVDGGLSLFFRNVTLRREAENQLRENDRRKDEFLAMLAHELRNPLAPIGAAAQLLQLGNLKNEQIQKTSEVIGRQVSHMTGLIDDLLDVSRVTRGLIELDKVALDIQQVINEAVEQVNPLVRLRGHELTIRLAPERALVSADKKRLVQVVSNVLNNAAKYTAEGGHLILCTTVRDADVVIEVTDDGIGMTPDMTKHAFDLFAQATRTSDRSSGGLGLGLALVKSLVDLHGGTVHCKSSGLDKGSTFSICLPLLLETAHPAARSYGSIDPRDETAGSKRILVVDDNVDAAEMLQLLLESMGHEVLVEHSAYRALERAKGDQPQVCILDIGLPEIDGNELARQLRAQPENLGTVLIAVTGYGQESDRVTALSSGFDHHLVKPVNVTKLLSILSAIKAL